jgi:hypothetical protein
MDSLEVAWGVHIHRCKRKHNPSLICTKCQSPLTNTYILGGCRFTAKLRAKRHNNTFRLLLQLLLKSNGRRWPILCADLGHEPVTNVNNLTVDIDTSSHTHHQGLAHSIQEGLQEDKSEIRTTQNSYQTTSYTRDINPNTTSQAASGRLASPLTRKAN